MDLRLESPTMIGIEERTTVGVVFSPPDADREDVHREPRERDVLIEQRRPTVT